MVYRVQVKKDGKWLYDGAYINSRQAIEYFERCVDNGVDTRIIVEKVNTIEHFKDEELEIGSNKWVGKYGWD